MLAVVRVTVQSVLKNYAAIVRIMSYTDIGRHINKLINVS